MGRRASGAPRALGAAAAVQACIVLAASLLASTVGPRDLAMRLTLIGSLAVAMGGQNAVVRRLAVPDLTTTVLTLTVTGLVADTTPQSVRGRRLISVLAMLASARPVELGAPADRAGCSPTSPIRTWRTGRSLLREQLPPPGADQGPLRPGRSLPLPPVAPCRVMPAAVKHLTCSICRRFYCRRFADPASGGIVISERIRLII
jgi:hypothetical protein